MSHDPPTASDEIRQTRPFQSPGQEAIVTLLLTADRLRVRIAERIAERADLTFQQYNVLRILRGAGRAGVPTLEIAERMVERTPGITRLLDRLERRGLVRRVRNEEDRRRVLCHLTPEGRTTLARVDPCVDAVDICLDEGLRKKDLRQLVSSLNTIRALDI